MVIGKLLKQKSFFIFFFLLTIGSILRLYRLRPTMQFLGDQGRDAVIARGILMERDPAFIGPVTSVGNMYLGPFYYYFMVFPLLLTYPDPSGPAYAVAIVGIITLGLIYILGKEIIGEKKAILAMALYTISPIIITNVRFSWNPNIVPFFALLLVHGLLKTIKGDQRYWLLVGIMATILFQLHYITLILIGCAGLIWFWQLFVQLRARRLSRDFLTATGLSMLLFILSLTPIFIFDLKHDFLNAQAFGTFFTGSSEGEGHFRSLSDPLAIFYAIIALTSRLFTETFAIVIPPAAFLPAFCILTLLGIKSAILSKEEGGNKIGIYLIGFVFLTSIFILAMYKESIFDHYLGFMFPITVLLLSHVIAKIWDNLFLRPLVLGVVMVFVIASLRHYPGTQQLGINVDKIKSVSDAIYAHVGGGETYDILLLSPTNDFLGMNYKYFLLTKPNKPAKEEDIWSFKALYVIDEFHQENPLATSQYKMAIWPNREIVEDFTVPDGPRVVKLIR